MAQHSGYYDLQVNGYGGIDFHNPEITGEQLHTACEKLRRDNTASILYTVITEHVDILCKSLRRLVELREKDPLAKEVISGVHIEGPFISDVDGYRGAHPKDAVRKADVDSMKRMLDAANGLTRIVTLAPEQDEGFHVTRLLAKQGVRVSAGHTNASMDQLVGAIDAGLSMYTHLGNGCPMQMHRHENIVQRALSLSDRLWLMFIADGAHVAFPALKNYLRAAGFEKTIVVTDAVAPAGEGPGTYQIGRWNLTVEEDLVIRSPDKSHLVGSAMTMQMAVKRLIENVGLTQAQADVLTKVNPRKAIPLG
jgi:N-acetylglucosamine-6-phosphate deacetylase